MTAAAENCRSIPTFPRQIAGTMQQIQFFSLINAFFLTPVAVARKLPSVAVEPA
jgi:hypothetical protein